MKKLVAIACSVFFLSNFSKVSAGNISDESSRGQRNLVKAIAVIVNTESNKKLPSKPVFVASSDSPLF
ncbi:MAG TPA: hypothetical protein VGC29_08200 [Flavisolibacter sp.]